MKRIAFVLPRMGIGGVERSFLGLLRYAPREELDITLILFSSEGELLGEVPDWVNIRYADKAGRIEMLRGRVSALLKQLGLGRLFAAAKSAYHALGPKLAAAARETEYDIAVAYNDGLAAWYVSKGMPAGRKLAFVHTDFLKAGYNAAAEREVYREFEQVFFCSMQSRQRFLELLPEFQAKTAVLPSCVDREYVQTRAREPCMGLEPGAVNLLTVGRLSHEKGLDKIPGLLARLKGEGLAVRWHVIGDGPERENLMTEARRLGVESQMNLLGAMTNPYPYIARCDVYVQPSNYEGYCIALAEARALCRPCVACDFSGAREQIRDGVDGFVTGMTIPEIYDRLKSLIQDADIRYRFSQTLSAQNINSQQRLFQAWWEKLC